MSIPKRLAPTLLFLAVVATTFAAADVTRTIKVEIPAGKHFSVENLAGSFRVVSGAVDRIVATATIHAETEDLAASVRFEPVSPGSAAYRVRYPYDRVQTFRYPRPTQKRDGAVGWIQSLFDRSDTNTTYDDHSVKVASATGTLLYADLEVVVPRAAIDGKFSNSVGLLTAEGIKGELTFATGSGEISVQDLDGKVEVATGSGDVEATRLSGSFRASAGSGDIRLESFEGTAIHCTVGSGDIDLESARSTKIETTTGSGDVAAINVTAESFVAGTGSGDVLLQDDDQKLVTIAADTGSGDVTLQLGANASFEALADQGSGDLVSTYGDGEAIREGKKVVGYRRGDGRTKIRVETGSGDVVIEAGGARSAI